MSVSPCPWLSSKTRFCRHGMYNYIDMFCVDMFCELERIDCAATLLGDGERRDIDDKIPPCGRRVTGKPSADIK